MEHFIARQAIYDQRRRLYGYELLFRRGLQDYFGSADNDKAHYQVIVNSFLLFGLSEVTEGTRAFLNASRHVLVSNCLTALPRQNVHIQLPDDLEPDGEVVAASQKLKSHGYKLVFGASALRFESLTKLADMVRIDFSADAAQRGPVADRAALAGTRMFGTHIETDAQLQEAFELGCELVQGVFFSLPTIVSRRDIPVSKLNLVRLTGKVNAPQMDIDEVAAIVTEDVAMTYKLLRLINSVMFGMRNKIGSVHQALVLLGETQIRKWISMLAFAEIATGSPREFLVSSLNRARTAELLAPTLGLEERSSELFLLGLFSRLDSLLGRPLAESLQDVPLQSEIKEAILGRPGRFNDILKLCIALEKGDWQRCDALSAKLRLDAGALAGANADAWRWTKEVCTSCAELQT